jgi:hypothetical protein
MTASGEVYGMGSNLEHQLGISTTALFINAPTLIDSLVDYQKEGKKFSQDFWL